MEHEVGGLAGTLTTISFLGFAITLLVDWVRNAVGTAPKWMWNFLSVAFGWLASFAFGVDMFHHLAVHPTALAGFAGPFLTGLVLAGWGKVGHELQDALSGVAKRGRG